MYIFAGTILRRAPILALLLLVGLCFYALTSVLYFRAPVHWLVPVLTVCAFLYGIIKIMQIQISSHLRFRVPHIIYGAILLLPAISLLGQFTLNLSAYDNEGRNSLTLVASFWLVGVLWFLLGAALATAWIPRSQTVAISLIVILLYFVWSAGDGGLLINYGLLSDGLGGERFSHLDTSEYAIFILALAYGLSAGWLRLLVIFSSYIVLFGLGGRTAMLSFIGATMLHRFYFDLRSSRARVFNLTVFVVAIAMALFVLVGVDTVGLVGKDLLFSQGYASDSSASERIDIVVESFGDLLPQALFGDPSLIIRRFNSMGAYMHNLLSAWQFYGAVFFLTLIFALFICTRFLMKNRSSWSDAVTVTFSVILLYVVIAAIVGRAVMFNIMWLALGFWLERIIIFDSSKPKVLQSG